MKRVRCARIARTALALAALLAAGCSKTPPSAPEPAPPVDAVRSVTPPARATGVLYDSGIEIEFVPPIKPGSIDSTTVFMKLDTARYPVTLSYDPASHVLRIVPRFRVQLKRTYTIEITPRVLTTSGAPAVPGGYFWQFTTNTVRRPVAQTPADGVTYESPHARLGWDPTDTGVGSVTYDVYVSDDSLALASGAVPRLMRTARPYYIPSASWGFEHRVYWRVDAINLTSGEALGGAVARFVTLPSDTPIDSTIAPLDRWGYYRRSFGATACSPSSMPCTGPGDFNGALTWSFAAAPEPLCLARAHLELQSNTLNWASRRPAIYFSRNPWSSCAMLSLSNPSPDPAGELAVGGPGYGLDWTKFTSDYFTAYIEATARYQDTMALQLVANANLTYTTSSPVDRYRGALMLYYYRLPPTVAASRTSAIHEP